MTIISFRIFTQLSGCVWVRENQMCDMSVDLHVRRHIQSYFRSHKQKEKLNRLQFRVRKKAVISNKNENWLVVVVQTFIGGRVCVGAKASVF